jgi:hypothetical protein
LAIITPQHVDKPAILAQGLACSKTHILPVDAFGSWKYVIA